MTHIFLLYLVCALIWSSMVFIRVKSEPSIRRKRHLNFGWLIGLNWPLLLKLAQSQIMKSNSHKFKSVNRPFSVIKTGGEIRDSERLVPLLTGLKFT